MYPFMVRYCNPLFTYYLKLFLDTLFYMFSSFKTKQLPRCGRFVRHFYASVKKCILMYYMLLCKRYHAEYTSVYSLSSLLLYSDYFTITVTTFYNTTTVQHVLVPVTLYSLNTCIMWSYVYDTRHSCS
jgi:hypothetical protein